MQTAKGSAVEKFSSEKEKQVTPLDLGVWDYSPECFMKSHELFRPFSILLKWEFTQAAAQRLRLRLSS